MRNNLIVWPILLIAGFLAGFIPQHSKANRLEQKVSASTAQIEACQLSEQLSQLRDAATLMYLEATQKNYGTSGDDANRFFDQAQRLSNSTQDEALRTLLGGDSINARSDHSRFGKRGCLCRFRDAAHSFKSGARHKTVGTIAAYAQGGS